MSMWHLLWIVPVSVCAGYMMAALIAANGGNE